MRIVILSDGIPPESSGGAETIAWSLARGLHALGHDIHVIAATRGKSFEETRDSIPTYHLHAVIPPRWGQYRGVINPPAFNALRDLLKRINPDVVNAHNVQNAFSFESLAAAHRLDLPVVWNSHDLTAISATRVSHFIAPTQRGPVPLPDYRLPPFNDLRRMGLRWNPLRIPWVRAILTASVDVRVSVSQAHAAAMMANGIPPLRVVHNGIDVQRFETPNPAAIKVLRDRLGLDGRPTVLFAGRLRREKGSTEILKAIDALIHQIPHVALLVLADRGYKPDGRAQRSFPHVFENHVIESGWLSGDDLVAAYHCADVVCVPSVYLDPFPTVNLEAMAAGRPVVATCFGGSPEAILDGETGFIVNPFDTVQFAARLETLLSDPALRQKFGEAGQRRAREVFSLDRYVKEMLALYQEASRQTPR